MQESFRFVNEPLPYSYKAMEPYIDIQTMYIHHDKHLQTYIDNLNQLVDESEDLQQMAKGAGFAALVRILGNLDALPAYMQTAVRNNAGGVFNHWFYFNGLAAHPKGRPSGALAEMILWKFGSFEQFEQELTEAALAVFGSGYAWLVYDLDDGLQIIQTVNQDTPIERGLAPILCVDVWEHAYYLKHKNLRKDYLPDWFAVVNWDWAQWCYENWESFVKKEHK